MRAKEVNELPSGGGDKVFLQHHGHGDVHDVAQFSLLKRLFWFADKKLEQKPTDDCGADNTDDSCNANGCAFVFDSFNAVISEDAICVGVLFCSVEETNILGNFF